MSCPNSNSPIDISTASGNCELKCAYNFKYPISSCSATNRGDYLSLKYDGSSNPPVTYNATPYSVTEIRIYNPSLHSYKGTKTAGEIVIVHNSSKGGNTLLVCVPIIIENANLNSKASTFLTTIIDKMSTTVETETENIPLNDFTLNDFVPKKSFFAYTATLPYQPCVGNADIIVFADTISTNCKISSGTLQKLQKITKPHKYTIKSGPLLFFNPKGPGSSNSVGGDDIYIDCKPTGTSDETTTVTKNNNNFQPIQLDTIIKSPAFQFIVCFLLIVLMIYLFKIFINISNTVISGKSLEFNFNPFNKSK